MSHPVAGNSAPQDIRDVILNDELGELPGTIFSSEGDSHFKR